MPSLGDGIPWAEALSQDTEHWTCRKSSVNDCYASCWSSSGLFRESRVDELRSEEIGLDFWQKLMVLHDECLELVPGAVKDIRFCNTFESPAWRHFRGFNSSHPGQALLAL